MTYETGAIRDDDSGKIDIEGSISPLALERYCEYMLKNTAMPDGTRRSCDNWQRGFPEKRLMQSLLRHVHDVWMIHRGWRSGEMEEALCAVLFNAQALLHERLREKRRL